MVGIAMRSQRTTERRIPAPLLGLWPLRPPSESSFVCGTGEANARSASSQATILRGSVPPGFGFLIIAFLAGCSHPSTRAVPLSEGRLDFGPDTLIVPQPLGFINDFAEVMEPRYETAALAVINEVKARSEGEIVVVTLTSLHGLPAPDVARRIGNAWGVGYAGSPDDPATRTGVVILLAPNEGEYRLELGDGASRFISDEEAGNILAESMAPPLRDHAYGQGLYQTVVAVGLRFAKRFKFALTAAEAQR
jgi:TLP18.3/Psb32/MOLO-1 phosphatase superfamily protein